MSRRRTKTERELIADMMDTLRVFCTNQPNCKSCPVRNYMDKEKINSCIKAYVGMLLNEEAKNEG